MTLKFIFNVENRNKYQIHAVCNAALQQILILCDHKLQNLYNKS